MTNERFLSVSDINKYINFKFEQDENLQEVYIQAEISNFKFSGKHCYFSLKDAFSELSAMYFYPNNLDLKFKPIDGMSVQVVGKIQVYLKKGTYAIIVRKMVEAGIGLLYQEYLELKDKLQKEGLFEESKKLPLPVYPEKIAVITAPTGEAIRDIISTFNRRFPLAKIKLYPALVQGLDAPKDLIQALKRVYQDGDADVIIIGRGGGSFEDLSCFNDENLARTLFSSPIPTVSAVGHEGDYTICDFVASHRAPTPTGAAMLLSKDKKDITELLIANSKRLKASIKNKLTKDFNEWSRLHSSYGLFNFKKILENKELECKHLCEKLENYSPQMMTKNMVSSLREWNIKLENAINRIYENNFTNYDNLSHRIKPSLIYNKIAYYSEEIVRNDLAMHKYLSNHIDNLDVFLKTIMEKLVILNPFHVMKKGYSIVYKDNIIVSSITKIHQGDNIKIKMSDGDIDAIIK